MWNEVVASVEYFLALFRRPLISLRHFVNDPFLFRDCVKIKIIAWLRKTDTRASCVKGLFGGRDGVKSLFLLRENRNDICVTA